MSTLSAANAPADTAPTTATPECPTIISTPCRPQNEQHTLRRRQCVLAPMVRTGELPTRIMSLKYGADLVWGPETVDYAIIGTTRTFNTAIQCVDFSKASNNNPEYSKVIFRTHPGIERQKLIFQLGTASPSLAVEAAKIVARDVAGLDVNAGCPKHFSIHSGMGAALLQTPDKLCDILTNLVKEVGPGTEYNLPISVKIRLLEPHSETFGLVERLVRTGICRLTVHMRTTPMRPREPAIRDPEIIQGIAKICQSNGVQIVLNGDLSCRGAAEEIANAYDLDGCMIARAAETNPSCFLGSEQDIRPHLEVAREYLKAAMQVDNPFPNTKFCLSHIIHSKSEVHQPVVRSKCYKEICDILEVEHLPGLTDDQRLEKKSEAVEKAKKGGNESAAAASSGGSKGNKKEKKKRSERGVSASSATSPTVAQPQPVPLVS
ncbi:hypothetical protein BDZ91DRAFT_652246 [Kalaharituber pfeilii]|nr:hypothetical protein BDZ91DRAFT_652246 [Kalaharituber pfeilii]